MLKATKSQIKTINQLADQYRFAADVPAHKDRVYRLMLVYADSTGANVRHRRMNVFDAGKFIEWARAEVRSQAAA